MRVGTDEGSGEAWLYGTLSACPGKPNDIYLEATRPLTAAQLETASENGDWRDRSCTTKLRAGPKVRQ
jgi:hypothetical protein